ncbi:aminoglycoside phosphotransferase family protein [Streptomyces sp. NPDC002055]|uniref:phosphotransferase family protein n=1 Tax=Streptomyces sp. NPDC002055 TaxID=3154534 RepID=UPI0033190952
MTEPHSTHHITITGDEVTKVFTSWSRGEPLREWRGLTLLDTYAPGLAPRPIAARLDSEPPALTMTRIDGTPLRGTTCTRRSIRALADGLTALHDAVPAGVLAEVPRSAWSADRADARVRRWMAGRPAVPRSPVVGRALAAGETWLAVNRLETVSGADAVRPVFGHADGNLANGLDDGRTVRLIDFEDSGRSDRAFELAEIVGHPSTWVDTAGFDVPSFLARFDLPAAEQARLEHIRRLIALLWLAALLDDPGACRRNPPGTDERQARRVLALLE